MIPILELTSQYEQIRGEVEEAVSRVLARTHYILGPEVAAFEDEFAAWSQGQYASGVGSGTEALHLALRALGIGPGDDVVCPPFTFIATAGAVCLTGARPIFCDIEPGSFNLDPTHLEAAITPNTKAILVVHLYGLSADMNPIMDIARRRGLAVVEDCAQACGAEYHGRKVGTIGDFGCYSFFPSKNLGGAGDGGMVLTNDARHHDMIRKLRGHGSSRKYFHEVLGTNSRLDELQAAILRVKLRYLDGWNRARQEVARQYDAGFHGTPVKAPPVPAGCRHVYHQYTIRTSGRDEMLEHLNHNGVGAVVYYPLSLHLQEVFRDLGLGLGSYPESERAQTEVLSLPMFPELASEQIQRVIDTVVAFHQSRVAKAG